MVRKDKVYIRDIITGAILLILLLSSLMVTKSPQGVQQVNVGQIGLPEKAVQELKDLLKP
jgi:uncharacterized membrane protein